MIISSKKDYWQAVDSRWPELKQILKMYLSPDLFSKVEELKQNRSTKLSTMFQYAWEAAPDNYSIHSIPGWGSLCDLCSESYILFEEDEEAEDKYQQILKDVAFERRRGMTCLKYDKEKMSLPLHERLEMISGFEVEYPEYKNYCLILWS